MMKPELTKEEIVARVSVAFDMGLLTRQRLTLMERWLDFVMRFEAGQMMYVVDFLDAEKRRNGPTHNVSFGRLAGDIDGYALIRFAALLNHKCQKCAEDPQAWHTRSALCPHEEQKNDGHGGGDYDDGC